MVHKSTEGISRSGTGRSGRVTNSHYIADLGEGVSQGLGKGILNLRKEKNWEGKDCTSGRKDRLRSLGLGIG